MIFKLKEYFEDDEEISIDDYFTDQDSYIVWDKVRDLFTDEEINKKWKEEYLPLLDKESIQEILKDYEVNSIDELTVDILDPFNTFDDLKENDLLEDEYKEAKEDYIHSSDFMDKVQDQLYFKKDPLGYYEMSQSDFI